MPISIRRRFLVGSLLAGMVMLEGGIAVAAERVPVEVGKRYAVRCAACTRRSIRHGVRS